VVVVRAYLLAFFCSFLIPEQWMELLEESQPLVMPHLLHLAFTLQVLKGLVIGVDDGLFPRR